MDGRLPNSEHEGHPWVIDRIAPDFQLLDAWDLPVRGGPGDFPVLLEVFTSLDPADAGLMSRGLFWVRIRLGSLLGWDDPSREHTIPGSADRMLSDRLPDDLRGTGDDFQPGDPLKRVGAAFVPLYRTDDEWAAEISNETVHGVLQLTWIDEGNDVYRGRLAVYVKQRGRLGDAYMALIAPFRHLIVYPELMGQIERAWTKRVRAGTAPSR